MGRLEAGFYSISSAPVIINGNVVVGSHVVDGVHTNEPSGVVRAYDVGSGRLAWAWDVGRPGQYGAPPEGQTYTPGTPNSWAPMSADPVLGLVYVPMGAATPDFWGAHRSAAADHFGSSVTALDARTGAPRWSFATVHHDVWDYDVPSQPTLADIRVNGKVLPALIQPTKRGEIFVLNRQTGKPIFPVSEIATPQGASKGDFLSPTQPFSRSLPSFGGPRLTERDMWGITPLDQLWCRIRFRELRYDGPMTPPNIDEALLWPGFVGGSNWGSASINPVDGTLIVNAIHLANIMRLVPRAEFGDRRAGVDHFGYGNGPYAPPQRGTPFGVEVTAFMSPLAMPCIRPPYGTLSAVDLRTGKLKWSAPVGTARNSGPWGLSTGLPLTVGTPNMGGTINTAGGLTFFAGTQDPSIAAFDTQSGKQLWYHLLPAGGQATPMTYISPKSGRQFVVIAAGGNHVMQSPTGDYVVAFALPSNSVKK
jgi:membrane-bound PQQ-dependent dehydrogenase (glucose/quinate/shikimate family)